MYVAHIICFGQWWSRLEVRNLKCWRRNLGFKLGKIFCLQDGSGIPIFIYHCFFSGVMKRKDLLGGQNACHLYNLVKICCTPLGIHTKKINLEIKKCIFKGETSFCYLLNSIVLIFWTLESRTLNAS